VTLQYRLLVDDFKLCARILNITSKITRKPCYRRENRAMRSGRRHEHLLSFELPPRGAAPANIRIYLIFRETRIIGLHFPADSMSLFSFTFFW